MVILFATALFCGVPFDVVSLFFGLIQTVIALTDLIDEEKEWSSMDNTMTVVYCTLGVAQSLLGQRTDYISAAVGSTPSRSMCPSP